MGAGKKHSEFGRAYRHRCKTRWAAMGKRTLKTSCNRAVRRRVREILDECAFDTEASEEAIWEDIPYASAYDVT